MGPQEYLAPKTDLSNDERVFAASRRPLNLLFDQPRSIQEAGLPDREGSAPLPLLTISAIIPKDLIVK